MNITDLLIDDIWEMSQEEMPNSVIHQVKRSLMDYIGVTYAGASSMEEEFKAYLDMNSEGGSSPILGLGLKGDFSSASLLNGYASHVLELDDGHRYGMLHLGAPVISALLTISEKEKLNFQQFSKGVVAGYEAAIRLARAIQPSHKNRGFHGTGTCGTIGVSVALAIALEYSKEELKAAIGFTATSASGILEVIDDGSQIKPYNVSTAVLNGINGAYFARLGLQGPIDVIGGDRGFLKTLTGEYKEEIFFTEKEAREYEIENIYVKPYAACRHCHSAIEGALKINESGKLDLEDIEEIEVETYELGVLGHDHTMIDGVSSAKMSTPYGVAAALVLNDVGINAFNEEVVSREDILELCKKIKVYEDKKLTAQSPGKRGALVRLYTKDGEVHEKLVEHSLGEPENNMSDKELEAKYMSLMEYSGKTDEKAKKIAKLIWSIEGNYDKFINML